MHLPLGAGCVAVAAADKQQCCRRLTPTAHEGTQEFSVLLHQRVPGLQVFVILNTYISTTLICTLNVFVSIKIIKKLR